MRDGPVTAVRRIATCPVPPLSTPPTIELVSMGSVGCHVALSATAPSDAVRPAAVRHATRLAAGKGKGRRNTRRLLAGRRSSYLVFETSDFASSPHDEFAFVIWGTPRPSGRCGPHLTAAGRRWTKGRHRVVPIGRLSVGPLARHGRRE